jgi:uncharacterized protein
MRLKQWLGGALIFAVILYALFLGALFFAQNSILYPGVKTRVASTPPQVPGIEILHLPTAAGNVEAMFLPATDTDSRAPKPALIFGHGNGEVTDDWVSALDSFRERGIGVLLVEYPGYGRSGGSPSEAGIRMAMDAGYDKIAADKRVDATRIFGFGQSLGGGAICLLAKDRPLRALILQSTFPSLDIFAKTYGAPAFLLHDHFESIRTVAEFSGPILVIHGRQDRLIPWQEGRRLAAASPHSTFKLYECGHGCWDPERFHFWQDAEPLLHAAGILQARAQ